MLIWLRYTKVQHNNHKTIFQNIFFAKYLYSLFLAFCNKGTNSVFLFLFQLLWNAFCVSLSNWSVKTDQLLFHHCLPKQVILVQVRHITRRDNRHKSMTHDTYDTCFYKCYTRARRKRDKYILKRKYNKRKSYKNRCHRCHVSQKRHILNV